MSILSYYWEDFSIDFLTGFLFLVDKKSNSSDTIIDIIDCFIKKVYNNFTKSIIDITNLVKVIINIVARYNYLLMSIIYDWYLLLILKFWSLLYYFLGIMQKLFIIFYMQIDGQTKRHSSLIEMFFCAFDNWEQND